MSAPLIQYLPEPQPQLIVTLTGPYLDITVKDDIRIPVEQSWSENLHTLVIDCASLEFVDSAGIGLLVLFHKRLGSIKGRVHLTNVKPSILSMLSFLCLEELFKIS